MVETSKVLDSVGYGDCGGFKYASLTVATLWH